MRTLVTGANGLVGANLVRELLVHGHDVRALVRQDSDLRSLKGLNAETVVGNVLQPDSLASCFTPPPYSPTGNTHPTI